MYNANSLGELEGLFPYYCGVEILFKDMEFGKEEERKEMGRRKHMRFC